MINFSKARKLCIILAYKVLTSKNYKLNHELLVQPNNFFTMYSLFVNTKIITLTKNYVKLKP